jgi:DNA polymerase-1
MAAQEIFNVRTLDKVTDEQRQLAKAGVHATNYGVSAHTLSRSLGITKAAAEKFIDRWLQAHPKIKQWQDHITLQLQATGMVKNIYGYRLKWLGRIDYHAIHAALAWGPQSSVAIYTRNLMISLQNLIDEYKAYDEIQLLLQTHDSLNWQIHKDHTEKWERRIKLLAQRQVAPYDDPLTIGFDIVRKQESWGI